MLSSVLVKNFEVGGAEFKVTVPFGSAATFHLDGTVDYKRHFAGATLRVEGSQPAPPPAEVFWNLTDVVEGIDGLSAELAALGRPPAKYLARPLTKTSTQDVVLNLVLATSAEQRDNPQLVQQGTARFLRTDAIGGAPVDVYRYGARTTYWVRKSDSLLMRVEADLAVATGTTVIDLVDHRAIEMTGPRRDDVVSAKDLPDEVIVRLTGVNATVKGS